MMQERIATTVLTVFGIGVLLVTAMFSWVDRRREQRYQTDATRQTISRLTYTIGLYAGEHGEPPHDLNTLRDSWIADMTNHPYIGPYVRRLPTDAWGTVLNYELDDEFPVVISAGPDRTFGTPDDIK